MQATPARNAQAAPSGTQAYRRVSRSGAQPSWQSRPSVSGTARPGQASRTPASVRPQAPDGSARVKPATRMTAQKSSAGFGKPARSVGVGGAYSVGGPGGPSGPRQGGGEDEGRRKGRKGPWRVVFWIALAVFVLSLAALAYIGYSYWQGQKSYDDIADNAFTAPESASLADFKVDWDQLRAINPDVVGWIYMPGTEINYPIAWREGDDSYYLTHNFSGATSAEFGAEYGCIMLSGVNEPDFSDTVNIIYGHNMANGSMFARLTKFTDADEFNAHRLVYLLTPQGNYLLRTFALVHVPGSSTDIIIPNFSSVDDRVAYMQDKYDRSVTAADPEGSPASEIEQTFALVTCDAADRSYRYIVYCEPVEFYPAGSAGTAAQPSEGTEAGEASAGQAADGLSDNTVLEEDLNAMDEATSARVE